MDKKMIIMSCYSLDNTMIQRILLFLYSLLPFFGGDCWAQVEKEKIVESDGFVWYKLSDKTTFQEGAENESGQSLVPTGDYMIIYQTTSGGWFEVLAANAEGAYSKDGKCVVPISSGYDEVSYKANQGFSLVKRNGKVGVCDQTGEEIIPCKYQNIVYSSKGFKYENATGKWVSLGVNLNSPNQSLHSHSYTDVSVFDLKGRVKSCTITENHTPWNIYDVNSDYTINFSPDGKLVLDDSSTKIERDSNGRLKKVGEYNISFDDKGIVKSISFISSIILLSVLYDSNYIYDNNGLIVQNKIGSVEMVLFDIADAFKQVFDNDYHIFNYTYTKFDSKGNWIERMVSDNKGEITNGVETRTITYY